MSTKVEAAGKLIVASYSRGQDAYHVETLGEFLQTSRSMAFQNISDGFMMIGLFDDYDQANTFIKRCEKITRWRL